MGMENKIEDFGLSGYGFYWLFCFVLFVIVSFQRLKTLYGYGKQNWRLRAKWIQFNLIWLFVSWWKNEINHFLQMLPYQKCSCERWIMTHVNFEIVLFFIAKKRFIFSSYKINLVHVFVFEFTHSPVHVMLILFVFVWFQILNQVKENPTNAACADCGALSMYQYQLRQYNWLIIYRKHVLFLHFVSLIMILFKNGCKTQFKQIRDKVQKFNYYYYFMSLNLVIKELVYIN